MPKRREWLFQLNLREKVSNGAKTSQMTHASNTFCRRYSLAYISVPKLPLGLIERDGKGWESDTDDGTVTFRV
jgi:hypothetical protein